MRLFEGIRPEVYIHGAKLRRDKKTGKRLWSLTLIVTLKPELVDRCCAPIEQAWLYILTLDNQACEVMLQSIAVWMSIEFYGTADQAKTNLHVGNVDLGGFRLTRDGETVELWFGFEAENNPGLHAFVKEYAFTRLWAEFKPRKEEIAAEQAAAKEAEPLGAVLDALDSLASAALRDGTTLTLSSPGMEPVVIDKPAAEKIHARAKAARKPKS